MEKNGKHTGSLGKISPLQEGAKMEVRKLPDGQWGGGGDSEPPFKSCGS